MHTKFTQLTKTGKGERKNKMITSEKNRRDGVHAGGRLKEEEEEDVEKPDEREMK